MRRQVGPGYNDERIRPWNAHNTKGREGGRYYMGMQRIALEARPDALSVTSYNEWGEGTQIE
jgi:glycoprotein endo-alpha-1,2-mannosidase